jgi:hypothetical protein
MARTTPADAVYQLRITLEDIHPPIWRRVQTRDCSLATLNRIIQHAMGWWNCHLHTFDVGGQCYSVPSPEWEVKDERGVRLSRLVAQGVDKLLYTYDMGENWRHTIQVEKTLPSEPGARYPICLGGERACPPEDCGGVGGYADLLAALRNRRHKRHRFYLDWLNRPFDPEAFDLQTTTTSLQYYVRIGPDRGPWPGITGRS